MSEIEKPDIRKIVTDAHYRMRESGESFTMGARWISEDVNRQLAPIYKRADAVEALTKALERARDCIEVLRPEHCGPWSDALKREIDAALSLSRSDS